VRSASKIAPFSCAAPVRADVTHGRPPRRGAQSAAAPGAAAQSARSPRQGPPPPRAPGAQARPRRRPAAPSSSAARCTNALRTFARPDLRLAAACALAATSTRLPCTSGAGPSRALHVCTPWPSLLRQQADRHKRASASALDRSCPANPAAPAHRVFRRSVQEAARGVRREGQHVRPVQAAPALRLLPKDLRAGAPLAACESQAPPRRRPPERAGPCATEGSFPAPRLGRQVYGGGNLARVPRQVPVHGRLAAGRFRAVVRFRSAAPRRAIAPRLAALRPAWTPEPRSAAGSRPAAPLQHEPGAGPDLISTRLQSRSCCATQEVRCSSTTVAPADVSAGALYTHVADACAGQLHSHGRHTHLCSSSMARAPAAKPATKEARGARSRHIYTHTSQSWTDQPRGHGLQAAKACRMHRWTRQAPDTSRLLAVNNE